MAIAMAKHILVSELVLAEQLKQKIESGQDFDKLAKRHSICKSGKKGGDLGEVKRGTLVKPVEQVIFKQAIKKVHGPVKSKFGYHLIFTYYRD